MANTPFGRYARKAMRHLAVPAVRPLLAVIASAIAVIGLLAATGASAAPALASVVSSPTVPANFSKLPAAWHGYAPPVTRAAAEGQSAAVDEAAAPCTGEETLYNQNSGLVMEVYESSTAEGGIVDQWSYNQTATQLWCFIALGSGPGVGEVYELINYNSGMCLDLPDDNLANGQHLQQWPCNGTEAQKWLFVNHDLYDTLEPDTAANSDIGFSYVMEVYGSSVSDGGEVDVWTGNDTPTQGWCPGEACTPSTRLCVDSSTEGNECMLGDVGIQDDPAELSTTYEGDIMQFVYPNVEGTTGAIKTLDGECLQLDEAAGDEVRVAACVGDTAEEWLNLYDATNGRTTFDSVYDPNLCLSADYDGGIIKADSCENGISWYQEWGTS